LARQLLLEGVPYEQVAKKVGRSVPSLQSRNSLFWHIDRSLGWSEAEDSRLKDLWLKGKSAEQISEELGRGVPAILERKKHKNTT
jgi:hypothetical protein